MKILISKNLTWDWGEEVEQNFTISHQTGRRVGKSQKLPHVICERPQRSSWTRSGSANFIIRGGGWLKGQWSSGHMRYSYEFLNPRFPNVRTPSSLPPVFQLYLFVFIPWFRSVPPRPHPRFPKLGRGAIEKRHKTCQRDWKLVGLLLIDRFVIGRYFLASNWSIIDWLIVTFINNNTVIMH